MFNGKKFQPSFSVSVNQALIIVFALGLLVGFGAGAVTPEDLLASPEPSDQQKKDFEVEGEPMLGEEDAPVTMFVFEDFECPFCKRFEQGAFQDIKKDYVDTGKVRVVWKDYPLPPRIHPWAGTAAVTMECVYRQDEEVFWKLKDTVFRNQQALSSDTAQNQIVSWASEEGVNATKVRECVNGNDAQNEVSSDMREGGQLGTPTVFIEGEKISGAQPYSVFKSVIDSKLE